MATQSLVLGTAGHIDHGKSTLIQALTGTDPDRLAEEKRRGITIELGFAQLTLPDGTTMGVVDVPGHERFVRQMIAGSTGIDVALLCIAADDGVMPQTVEHLQVLELLGVSHLVIALTKADLVDAEWGEFVADEIRDRLASTPYAESPIVTVSARSGEGLDQLKETIAKVAKGVKRTKGQGIARLPIDRSFTIKGSGTVITGTLWSGTVAPGDELELLPVGTHVRVRGVQEHGVSVEKAQAGNRTAVNLANIGTDEVRPGMMLATPGAVHTTDRFDAWLTYLGAAEDSAPLESGVQVRVAHGTSEIPGRVLLMDGSTTLPRGNAALVQIRLDEPLPVSREDRFVIRSVTPVHVIGGGRVLLYHPRRRTTLSDTERTLLEALRDGNPTQAIDAAVTLQSAPATAQTIAQTCGLDQTACTKRLEQLVEKGSLEKLGEGLSACYVDARTLRALSSKTENALMRFHTMQPDKTGLAKQELLDVMGVRMNIAAFDAVLARLQAEGRIVVDGGEVSHPTAGAGAKKREEEAANTLAAKLAEAGITPSTIAALTEECKLDAKLAHRALGALEQQGMAARVGDYYFDAKALAAARDTVVAHLTEHGPSTAADLKDAMGVSRKHAIPLLEYFDARGITRREGDARALGPAAGGSR